MTASGNTSHDQIVRGDDAALVRRVSLDAGIGEICVLQLCGEGKLETISFLDSISFLFVELSYSK